jgi:hypothetical protein
MAVFIIIIVALLTGLAYAVLFLVTKLVQSFRTGKLTVDKNLKRRLLLASFAFAALTTYFFVFTSPATNYKTAYIEKEQQHYKVTVKGKRLYMVHDPVSLFVRKTYEDSAQYILPRSEGVIKGQELPTKEGYYKSVGDIIIKDGKLRIELSADNYDDKKLDPDTWNGDYKLLWRQK